MTRLAILALGIAIVIELRKLRAQQVRIARSGESLVRRLADV